MCKIMIRLTNCSILLKTAERMKLVKEKQAAKS